MVIFENKGENQMAKKMDKMGARIIEWRFTG